MNKRTLTEKERLNWIRLARTQNVGPVTFRQLLHRYKTAEASIKALPDLAQRGGRKSPLAPASLQSAENEISQLEKLGGWIVCLCEPDYPALLAEVEDAPPVISVLGNPTLLDRPQIGIVGARNASLNGRKMAEKLASDLGAQGYVITSGLARGIDTSAHQRALATGTVAVVASGIDVVYPEENRKLYEQILAQGCLIAEQPLGTQPQAKLFPRRNRLISGLSLGVIVVEAAKQSGSLITARLALEQGREVFAVPGSPLDPRAAGTNSLLRQGAILTETAQDVLEHLHRPRNLFAEESAEPFDEPALLIDESYLAVARAKIIENLSTSPISVDELVRQCQLSLPHVLTVLLELELAGRLDRQPGHQVALIAE